MASSGPFVPSPASAPYKEAKLILQSSPVRSKQILTADKKSVTGDSGCDKYLVFAQGCKLFHRRIFPGHDTDSSEHGQLQEFQVFPVHYQITAFTLNSFTKQQDSKMLVISKDRGVILSWNPTSNSCMTPISTIVHLRKWVSACVWISVDKFVTLTAQNELFVWTWNDEKLERSTVVEYKIPEIYSGRLYLIHEGSGDNDALTSILVCSGTVFGAFHLWNVRNGRANVLCVVEDHQGPITGIQLDLNHKYLITTSDDRSAKLYHIAFIDKSSESERQISLSLHLELYGHTGRVYQGIVTSSGAHIVTSSNDGTVCIWRRESSSKDGGMEIVRRWSTNGGAPVRTIAYDDELDILFTGGDDGSVQKWNVGFKGESDKGNLDEDTTELYPAAHSHVQDWGHPRLITLIDEKGIIGASHSPELRTYGIGDTTNVIWTAPTGLKFTAIVFSPDRSLLAVGGSTGLLLVGQGDPELLENALQLQLQGTVSNIKWFSESDMVVSTRQALYEVHIAIGKLEATATAIPLQPAPKIPAAMLAPYNTEDTDTSKEYLLLGDENGVLRVFQRTDGLQAWVLALEAPKWHAKYGISSLRLWRGQIVSTGRDCYVKMFVLGAEGVSIKDLKRIQTPFEWIDNTIIFCSSQSEDLLCVGFRETKFLLYSMSTRSVLLEVECGGAHRSYDYQLSKAPTGGDFQLTLAYIRNKQILRTKVKVFDWLNPLKTGIPNLKINCAVRLDFNVDGVPDRLYCYFACGGEDKLISLFAYYKHELSCSVGPRPQLRLLSELDGHHSGIRALHYAGSGFLFSGGGRSQLIAWRLRLTELGQGQEVRHERLQMLTLIAVDSDKDRMDVRVLDIQSQARCQAVDGYIVCGACSDGRVHVLSFSPAKRRPLQPYAVLEPPLTILHAISRLFLTSGLEQQAEPGNLEVYGLTTNGYMHFWKLQMDDKAKAMESKATQVIQSSSSGFRMAESPVTACFRFTSPDPDLAGGNSTCSLVLGCDDGSLHTYKLSPIISATGPSFLQEIPTGMHTSTISAIELLPIEGQTNLVTCSVDNVVAIWSVDPGMGLKCISELRAGVNDCHGVIVSSSGDIMCFGDGIAIIQP